MQISIPETNEMLYHCCSKRHLLAESKLAFISPSTVFVSCGCFMYSFTKLNSDHSDFTSNLEIIQFNLY